MSYAALFVYKGHVAMFEGEDKALVESCGFAPLDDILGHDALEDVFYCKPDELKFDVFTIDDLVEYDEIQNDYDENLNRAMFASRYQVVNSHGYEIVNDTFIVDVLAEKCSGAEEIFEPAF